MLEEHGQECRVLLQDPDRVELFSGIGTPCAYLVDEEGKTASELVVGPTKSRDWIRAVAGLDSDEVN